MSKKLRIRLIHHERDETLLVPGDRTVIGRAESLLAAIPSCQTVSRKHLEVRANHQGIWVRDLGSSNGSWLDRERLPANEWVKYGGQGLILGDLENGASVSIESEETSDTDVRRSAGDAALEAEASKLSEKIELLNREIAIREQERSSAEERQKVMVKRVEELIFREVELFRKIDELKLQSEEILVECEALEQTLKDWEDKKLQAEQRLTEHESSLAGIDEINRQEEVRLLGKKEELRKASEAQEIEFERLEAERKLKSAQLENELEELRSKKLLLERELDGISAEIRFSEERIPKLKAEWDTLHETVQASRTELKDIRDQIPGLKSEAAELESRIAGLKQEEERARGMSDEIIDGARKESDSILASARRELETLETRLQGEEAVLRNRLDRELEELRSKAVRELVSAREASEKEMGEARQRLQRDLDSEEKARREELRAAKERGLEEIRVAVAAENQKQREALTDQRVLFSKRVAQAAVKEIESRGERVSASTMAGLENALLVSMEDYARGAGFQVETYEESKQRFLRRAALWTAAGVAAVAIAIYGPDFMREKYKTMKAENEAAHARFMKDLSDQRARMLALELEVKSEFQETYVDNILYNPGYLALKQDEAMQKEWTVALSKFFFEQLLLDDQKTVNYLPAEAGLIRALGEINQVLNKTNFEANLAKMKGLEEARLADLWLAAGGRENWAKLRKFEADFYRARVTETGEPIRGVNVRTPAGN